MTTLHFISSALAREERLSAPAAPAAPPVQPLRSVCAWCQQERGERPGPHESHGICARHLAAMKADLERRAA